MLGILAAGLVLGAAFNIGTRAVDGVVNHKDDIKAAYKRGMEAVKNKEDEKDDK